jgi:hypothetical protein
MDSDEVPPIAVTPPLEAAAPPELGVSPPVSSILSARLKSWQAVSSAHVLAPSNPILLAHAFIA